MSPPSILVVSGAPATGKSTVAKATAQHLGLPLIDKDDILEDLFEALGVGDASWRNQLSRASDLVFLRILSTLQQAVVVSFWRHPDQPNRTSGTPIDVLRQAGRRIIEVYCDCDPETTLERFRRRVRHPGHLDSAKGSLGHLGEEGIREYCELGPLGVGELVSIDTGGSMQELQNTLSNELFTLFESESTDSSDA